MPSSYTSLLKFAKPGLGDTGWGTTVNGGFTDMTEQALTGYVQKAVTVAGPNTIPTIADGASSDGRNQFIELTGTLASPATLTVPAGTLVGSAGNNKLYFIKNSAGDAVTITTGGANTVVVPNGKSMMLRATSAGVEEAMTHQASLTLGTALGATSGGTGQSSYAVGDLLYASSTTALSKLTVGAANAVLTSSGTAPQWTATLGVASGGTGATTLTGYVKGNGTGAMTASANVPVADLTGTLPVANGGTGQTTAATAFDALKQAATDTYVGAVELATTAEVQAGTDTARAMTPSSFRGGALVQGVAQNTTSGTSIDFAPPSAGIPSWAKRITIMFSGVSTNGTSPILVQIGDSGGIETTGYESEAWYQNAAGAFLVSTDGFIIDTTNTASFTSSSRFGIMQICNLSGNNWVYVANIFAAVHNSVSSCAGGKTLSGTLDRIRLTTVGGTDTFDAGSVNILYE